MQSASAAAHQGRSRSASMLRARMHALHPHREGLLASEHNRKASPLRARAYPSADAATALPLPSLHVGVATLSAECRVQRRPSIHDAVVTTTGTSAHGCFSAVIDPDSWLCAGHPAHRYRKCPKRTAHLRSVCPTAGENRSKCDCLIRQSRYYS